MRLISSAWTVIIIAISLSLAIVAYAFFYKYRPMETEIAYSNDLAQKLEDQAALQGKAQKRVEKAIQLVNEASRDWVEIVATRTPPTSVAAGGINLAVDPYTLLADTVTFRNNIQRAVNAQILKGGVKLVDPGPYIPGPTDFDSTGGLLSSFYNYPDYKFPILIYNLGTIRVSGTYEQIMANVEAYKTMPHYLAVTDGLRIDGTSPNLIGTYQLTIVGFIQTKKLPGPVPEGEAQAGSASLAGMRGGAMGRGMGGPGMPGMPPGLMGPGGPGGMRGPGGGK